MCQHLFISDAERSHDGRLTSRDKCGYNVCCWQLCNLLTVIVPNLFGCLKHDAGKIQRERKRKQSCQRHCPEDVKESDSPVEQLQVAGAVLLFAHEGALGA